MERKSTALPTFLKMGPPKGVEGSKGAGVLNAVMELIPNIEKVFASAFGPNGRAILFVRGRSSTANSTSPVITRTGLEMIEILSSKNEYGAVHPLLKSLVDICRKLYSEWGDGVKSLVLITCELLRICGSLDSPGPSWLRTELQKALCCLQHISESFKTCGSMEEQSCAGSESDNINDKVETLAVSSEDMRKSSLPFVSESLDILQQFEMFFATRFPPHICDVVSPLLFKWVSNLAEKSSKLSLEYFVDNFNFLSHVDVGLSTDQSCLIQGILFHGVGIGSIFEVERKNRYEGLLDASYQCLVGSNVSSLSSCNEIKFLIEEELNEFDILGKSSCEPEQCLFFTSSVVEESLGFKIKCVKNLSVIHSIPKEELDFINSLFQHTLTNKSDNLRKIECIRRWTRGIVNDSSIIWLKIPSVETIILSVPTREMSEGLQNSCQNAMQLISQLNYYIKNVPDQCYENNRKLDEYDFNLLKSSPCPTLSTLTSKVKSCVALNMLPIDRDLGGKELLPEFLSKNILIDSGGHAEILFHNLISNRWLAPPLGCKYSIERSVTEAISKACLKIPISLGKNLLGKPSNDSLGNIEGNHKELIVHRLIILQYAVSVVQAWSNTSHVQCISSHSSLANIG